MLNKDIDRIQQHEKLQQLAKEPLKFWAEHAKLLDWYKTWENLFQGEFSQGNIKWFTGAELNVSVNCLDRHLPQHAEKIAFYEEGNARDECDTITYQQLFIAVCQTANKLKKLGVNKGDRVCIYIANNISAVTTMLACARIGAVHSVIFGGFSANSLAERINDCNAKILVTQGEAKRGTKTIPLQKIACSALRLCNSIEHIIIKEPVASVPISIANSTFAEIFATEETFCEAEKMQAEDPLFILYTSGSTGKPKGMLHTTAGYLLYAMVTHRYVFDLQADDVYWCAADVGWITGHSYIVYGPLANATTSVLFSGIPTHPNVSRYWEIIDKYKVNILYTAPTTIRTLMQHGEQPLQNSSRDSLRVLGSVGEPISPDVWQWYATQVGKDKCSIVDTWWQTETGGIMLSAIPFVDKTKPGAAQKTFYTIQASLVDAEEKIIDGNPATGALCISQPWPGMARTIYGNHERYMQTYFSIPGLYLTGDGASRDNDGDYWISGRVDDVINVSGHRLGSAEIEYAAMASDVLTECAAIGLPHQIKGEAIYIFATAKEQQDQQAAAEKIKSVIRSEIGAIATPEQIIWVSALPKTRSGKLMRRLLRKIVTHDEQLGDLTTLANPESIQTLQAVSW